MCRHSCDLAQVSIVYSTPSSLRLVGQLGERRAMMKRLGEVFARSPRRLGSDVIPKCCVGLGLCVTMAEAEAHDGCKLNPLKEASTDRLLCSFGCRDASPPILSLASGFAIPEAHSQFAALALANHYLNPPPCAQLGDFFPRYLLSRRPAHATTLLRRKSDVDLATEAHICSCLGQM